MIKIDYCSICDCGKKRPIVNKTHKLCAEKNRERLDNQGSTISKKKSVKVVSDKRKIRLINLKTVYEEIAKERDHECTGCKTTKNLTHSHLIPISRRKDLETEKRNITYHCVDCHYIYEHGGIQDRQELLDFDSTMEYIKEADISYYSVITTKLKMI